MSKGRFRREAELYPILKKYFERQGYAVYAEVPAQHGGYVDLLAVRGERSAAVELKLRFSRLALRQAARNHAFVWQSFVAVEGPWKPDRRRRRMFTRRNVGLLLVEKDGVKPVLLPAESAPAFTLRQAFGPHLEGTTAQLYASAAGGVPTRERVSAYRTLVARVEQAIGARGGVASTEQILEDTLGWNYYRARRAGLRALLEARFQPLAPDLWSTPAIRLGSPATAPGRVRPAIHAVRMERVVRTHDPTLRLILEDSSPGRASETPESGDVLWFVREGRIRARALVKFAGRYPVKQTPQRELRAGPAIFFPWRLGGQPPERVLVVGLSGFREVAFPKPLARELPSGWMTLRPRGQASSPSAQK